MSKHMEPHAGFPNEYIAHVIYDGLCSGTLQYDEFTTKNKINNNNNDFCSVTYYYIYKDVDNKHEDVHNLEDYINVYNIKHTEDANKDKGSLDMTFDNIFIQILTGLLYLHNPSSRFHNEGKSIMHQNIIPKNIYLTNNLDTNQLQCKLGNFLDLTLALVVLNYTN
eukprot:GHVR01185562.1.p1 GENE.GHVR01185562.1~~GHVR01185562.1.p1  ORF type:complete len:166 (-),score=29.91 GHVR01185562.1:698-1195(-)